MCIPSRRRRWGSEIVAFNEFDGDQGGSVAKTQVEMLLGTNRETAPERVGDDGLLSVD
jgi:hypothetical protein